MPGLLRRILAAVTPRMLRTLITMLELETSQLSECTEELSRVTRGRSQHIWRRFYGHNRKLKKEIQGLAGAKSGEQQNVHAAYWQCHKYHVMSSITTTYAQLDARSHSILHAPMPTQHAMAPMPTQHAIPPNSMPHNSSMLIPPFIHNPTLQALSTIHTYSISNAYCHLYPLISTCQPRT
ncbi:hypothetical protein CesoFtcFv8_014248 [Champsocephalus esox]|uniref:Uncharacterized protein n=1 Tax=Champsocephalus esox TaxID=159716 RepID=A0AAN8BWJ4_9TELE|nr:hypothetical protein CesoFtcFv8_014248 [Champsocephalus esox]